MEPNLRSLREARGLRKAQVAATVGVSEAMIALIENGQRQPSLRTLRGLAQVYDLSLDAIDSLLKEPDAPAS